MVNKKKEGLSRLFEIAGQKKSLLLLAGLLSAGSAVCMLIPYWTTAPGYGSTIHRVSGRSPNKV